MRNLIVALVAPVVAASFFAAPVSASGPKHCPPGLAKKGNCSPPGQLKKRYQVGHALPSDVSYQPVQWQGRYQAPPAGVVYGQVDGDVVLIAEGTRKVIELIGIANALAN